MAGPLSYEPSVEAILAEVLPASTCVLAGANALRRRVGWLVLARATGLGEIEGGELLLVPGGRSGLVLTRLSELEAAGVAGAIIVGEIDDSQHAISEAVLPVLHVPAGSSLRQLQAEIERYIARRRRELFSLGHELHRSLTEAAIAGAGLETLLAVAHRLTGHTVVFDRDGDELAAPAGGSVPEAGLIEARIALHGVSRGTVRLAAHLSGLAAPVMQGIDRRGLVLLAETTAPRVDDDEAVIASLASACAIVLARSPEDELLSLAALLQSLVEGSEDWLLGDGPVTAMALRDADAPVRQIERAVAAELSVRGITHRSGTTRDVLVAFVAAGDAAPWEALADSLARRLGTTTLAVGLGRTRTEISKVGESSDEALAALNLASGPGVVRFRQIEIAALLRACDGWKEFAESRLSPILDGSPAHLDLLETLRAYVATGRNAKEAAERLHIHRNTLAYRMRRLRELLDVDLEDQDTLFELELALRTLDARAIWVSGTGVSGIG